MNIVTKKNTIDYRMREEDANRPGFMFFFFLIFNSE